MGLAGQIQPRRAGSPASTRLVLYPDPRELPVIESLGGSVRARVDRGRDARDLERGLARYADEFEMTRA